MRVPVITEELIHRMMKKYPDPDAMQVFIDKLLIDEPEFYHRVILRAAKMKGEKVATDIARGAALLHALYNEANQP